MFEKYDIAIVGGGMAGLSLAVRLADDLFSHFRIVIIEPRTRYERDRTWCYWNIADHPHPFSEAVSTRWPSWTVRDTERSVTRTHEHANYEMIPADQFYELALKKIALAKHIHLHLGVSVDSVQLIREEATECVEIRSSKGRLRAALAFDSRPAEKLSFKGGKESKNRRNPAWIQAFQGIEVETEEAVFDQKTVTLMDFYDFRNALISNVSATTNAMNKPRPPTQVRFMYVLPLSPTRALLEDTTFSEIDTLQASDGIVSGGIASDASTSDEMIAQYLQTQFGVKNFRIVHREKGAIPMDASLRPSHAQSKIVKIGAAGGMARASSGYAFFETQRACDAIAKKLAATKSLDTGFAMPRWRSDFSYWMDAVFLRVLAQQPGIAPSLFATLFARVPAQRLVRFLSGVARPMDTISVVLACPKWPFLKAVWPQ